jgi:hypothetical protein
MLRLNSLIDNAVSDAKRSAELKQLLKLNFTRKKVAWELGDNRETPVGARRIVDGYKLEMDDEPAHHLVEFYNEFQLKELLTTIT